MKARVLVVDDDAGVRYTVREILESAGLEVDAVESAEQGLGRMALTRYDLVITDLLMPGMDGLAFLRAIQKDGRPPRVILITAHGNERTAVEAMKAGAWDYFKKPFEVEELLAVVERAVEAVRLTRDNERLAGERSLGRTMVFASPSMSHLAVLVQRVAPRNVTVLITGESGTGKERVAEAIVAASARADRPFVKFNCAALTPELAEAELFGHSRGAFTGAVRARPGLFGEATAARSSWTRSASSTWAPRRGSSGSSRRGRCGPSGRSGRGRWTCASSPPPTATSRTWSPGGSSGRTSTIA